MQAFIFAISIIIWITLGIAVLFRVRMERALPVSVMAITFLLYIAGFFGNLKNGFYLILAGAIIVLPFLIYVWIKDRKRMTASLSPYILYYVAFGLWLYIRFAHHMLIEWDEFTHWGFTTKVMFDSNMFSNEPGSTIYFVDYLPGTALFQYFVMQFCGTFSEGFLSIAQGLFIFSFLMPVLGEIKIGWKQFLVSMAVVLTLFILPMGFYPAVYSSLYVDACLAVVFGYLVFVCLREKEYDVFFYVNAALACGTLCIIKPSGIGLMVIAAILIFADKFVQGRYKQGSVRKCLLVVARDLIPFVVGYLYKLAWSIRLKRLGYGAHFDTKKITLQGILDVFAGRGEEYQQATWDNFKGTFFGWNYLTVRFDTLFAYAFVFVMLAVLVYIIKSEYKKRCITIAIASVVTYVLYSFYMLFLYLFTYSPDEAVSLASFHRYEYTIILGLLIAFVCWLIFSLLENDKRCFAGCLTVFVCICFMAPNRIVIRLMDVQANIDTQNARKQYEVGERVREKLSADDKVYIVSENSDGYDYFVLRYTLSPVHTQTRRDDQAWVEVSWNIGQPNDKGPRRRVITADEWMDDLIKQGYSHVLLYNIDEQFCEEFESLFDGDVVGKQLYKVDEKTRRLQYVDLSISE